LGYFWEIELRTNVTSPDVSPSTSNHKTTNPFKNTSECLVFCPTNISLAERVKSTNTVQIWKRLLIAYMGGMAGIIEGSYSYTCPMPTQRNAAPRQQTIPLKNRPELWTPCSNQNTQQDISILSWNDRNDSCQIRTLLGSQE